MYIDIILIAIVVPLVKLTGYTFLANTFSFITYIWNAKMWLKRYACNDRWQIDHFFTHAFETRRIMPYLGCLTKPRCYKEIF